MHMNGWKKNYLHSAAALWPSPDLHLKEIFSGAFFFEFGGLELGDLLFSIVRAVGARQGKQLFGKMPQLSNIPPPVPRPSSTGWLDISSWLTKGFAPLKLTSDWKFTPFTEVPVDWSPSFELLCFCSVEVARGTLEWSSPQWRSLRDCKLNVGAPSNPFKDSTSVENFDRMYKPQILKSSLTPESNNMISLSPNATIQFEHKRLSITYLPERSENHHHSLTPL